MYQIMYGDRQVARVDILDYLVGNVDRHWGNWRFLVENDRNRLISLHPLMDFNLAFGAYDTLDGARCQTVLPLSMTQKEAAVEGVKKIGLPQISEIEESWFVGREEEYAMLLQRLEVLREAKG